MIDLAELLRLEQAATPAPWQEGEGYDSDAIVHPLPSYQVPLAQGGSFTERPRPETVFSGGSVGDENASLSASAEDKAFVIALRNAFSELASELTTLKAENERLNENMTHLAKMAETEAAERLRSTEQVAKLRDMLAHARSFLDPWQRHAIDALLKETEPSDG